MFVITATTARIIMRVNSQLLKVHVQHMDRQLFVLYEYASMECSSENAFLHRLVVAFAGRLCVKWLT